MTRCLTLSCALLLLTGCPAANTTQPAAPAITEQPAEPPALLASEPKRTDSQGSYLRVGEMMAAVGRWRVGISEVRQDSARLTVAWRALSFHVDVAPKDRVWVADGELEVLGLTRDSVRWRWVHAPARGSEPARTGPGPLRLRACSFNRLDDGVVIAVGRVGSTASIQVFPKDYATRPMQDYDAFVGARPGAELKGKVASFELASLHAGSSEQRGEVVLTRARP